MKEELVEYQFYLQPKLASEIWEFGTNFFRFRAFVFPCKTTQNLVFLHFSGQQRIPPSKPGRLAAWCCCARAVAPPLRALRAAACCARGCAQPRVVARGCAAAPLAPAGGAKEEREREFEGGGEEDRWI